MKLKTALLAAVAAAATAPAANAQYEGLYGAIGAGLNLNPDLQADSALPAFVVDQDYDRGIGVYTALGYAWGNNWRTEIEFSYRNNNIDSFGPNPASPNYNVNAFPSGTISGDLSTYALMFNIIRDFDFGWLNPYIGGGVGFSHAKAQYFGVNAPEVFDPLTVNDSDRRFAYQGIAGFAIPLAESLMLDISYRYFRTRDDKFVGLNPGPFQFNSDNRSHSVFAGLRWNFGGGAAVQYKDCWDGSSVPVSAECPAQPVQETTGVPDPIGVIVYFDYDKSNLTAEADALIREAAQRALQNDIQTVKVEGNADRSGGSAYNQALSQRRANVVRDRLIQYGVPADRITVSAFGEDNPAKPTDDGVREPLNRRTEVTITFE